MTDLQRKKRVLGKGLDALLSPRAAGITRPAPNPIETSAEQPVELPIDQIQPNPLQPRSVFHQQALDELSQSIRANGIIQPLIVRRIDNSIQLVAGERRLRAAKLAGLKAVPVVFTQISDGRLLEVTLIENIQREDLNPLEIAEAYQRLILELGLNHEQIAERTGKDRSNITNHLRLLRLPPEVQQLLADRRLSMGHARALVAIEDASTQIHLANQASAESLSVREVERLVRDVGGETKQQKRKSDRLPDLDPNWKAALAQLQDYLGTRVRIHLRSPGKGRLEIDFYSEEELQRIYATILEEQG
ncbi:MAG: ParB/RepB/Spo0J family partition protein [Bryobacterales bacterium]|nr:ParB/RepB/Spo0J family partition protein [Bryobacterales bacterium]